MRPDFAEVIGVLEQEQQTVGVPAGLTERAVCSGVNQLKCVWEARGGVVVDFDRSDSMAAVSSQMARKSHESVSLDQLRQTMDNHGYVVNAVPPVPVIPPINEAMDT